MENPTPIPELGDTQARKLRRWRRTQAVGGLLLASSFFMPAVESCNSPLTPAEVVYDGLRGLPGNILELDDWLGLFMWCIAAYLFGFTQYPYVFPFVLFLIGMFLFFKGAVRYWVNLHVTYTVTNRRVINMYRFLWLHTTEIPVSRIKRRYSTSMSRIAHADM